ncbi:MAG: NADH-quinone oxidoreductase subunit H [Deltaproteobacteria bacterium]|nr:NADH-quinone oxidoreductase subunit H [Deltaproteobacteria bacterium]
MVTTIAWLTLGCATSDSADLLNVIDVAPRDIEVGDRVEVLGSSLASGDTASASVIFEGKLHRPGQDPVIVESTCGPGKTCIKIDGAKPSPDKVSFRFTEALQTQFCGSRDKAMHTTFRGNVIVELQPGVEGGRPVRGKVMNITLDFRPPSARRVVMAERNARGQKVVEYLGITIDDQTAPAAGGLRIAEVRADSPADKSGIAPGDVLLSIAGVNVTAIADIAAPSGAGAVPASVQRGEAKPLVHQLDMSSFEAGAIPAGVWGALLILASAIGILLLFMAPTAGIITWVERRVAGRMQSRVGPNRAGPQGFFIWLADGIKSIMKEDIIPAAVDQSLFRLAPYLVFIGVSATFVVMPFGQYLIAANLDIGILFVVAVTSLVAIGLMTGGWASNNKWSLLGAIRAAAQIISYEIPAAVAIVCIVMMTGSLRMQDIIIAQGGIGDALLSTGGWPWYWYMFRNPVTFGLFFLYFTTALAEGNRGPFDMPEAESELVAGYSTEYSGMRYVFFFFAEWANIFVFCGIAAALFLGGWQVPGITPAAQEASIGLQLLGTLLFLLKAWVLIFVVIWVKWTLPRIRIDQLMSLCWKWFVPMSFAAFMLTGLWVIITSAAPIMGKDGLPVRGAPLLSIDVQTIIGSVMVLIFLALTVHFARRVRYNLKQSRQPIHLNPFI